MCIRRWRLVTALLVGGGMLLLFLLMWGWSPVQVGAQGPKTFTVDTDSDVWTGSCADKCTLREALALAKTEPGTDPVTITFDSAYVITLTRDLGSGVLGLSVSRDSGGPVIIDGDLDDDGTPDVTINGENLSTAGSTILWVKGDHVTIDGLIFENAVCAGCWGLNIHGDDVQVLNSWMLHNYTGLYLTNGAAHSVISNCVMGNNLDNGVFISAKYSLVGSSYVITPAHHITITNSYIGTNASGDDLGNLDKGVVIQRGVHNVLLQGNTIANNGCYGVYLRGGDGTSSDPFAPPTNNTIDDNTIQGNGASCSPQAAVVNERTHAAPGSFPSLSGGYDNVISRNVITGNTGMGIYNIGASPLITGNTVMNNTSYGIYNTPSFGDDYNPANASDDILAIPIIKNNTIDGNGQYGIYSLDSAPVDRYTLHTDNTIGDHALDVLQVWYGAVEVLTGTTMSTTPITQGITVRVQGNSTGWMRMLSVYDGAEPTYASGVWGDTGLSYNDVSTWPGIREFEVMNNGTLVNHLTHTVQVFLGGQYTGTVLFSFDGMTTTDPISGDVLIPQWIETGPFGRYQVAEVNFTRDTDNDSIPDVIEGPGDTDNDGIPDYQDTDSDNDGIPDDTEGNVDTDGDGIPDYQDTDSDNDGIPDDTEGNVDTDGDGIPDYQDTDSDNDGIPDEIEGTVDTDGDNIPDYQDTDSDNDGIPDETEGADDVDGDGVPNFRDTDSDGDGISDTDEGSSDTDNDGIPDFLESNTDDPDGDGIPNYQDTDSDGDGIPDGDEFYSGDSDTPLASDCTLDTDGDKIPNCHDNDVDGDGIINVIDGDSDGDGIPDAQEGTGDSDNDGVPDWLDDDGNASDGGDSDGDGLSDMLEYSSGAGDTFCTDTTVDTDGDDTPNCQDNDVDGDGVPNYLDPDSDGDGTPDAYELTPPETNPSPFTHADVPAWIDPLPKVYLPMVLRSF